MRTLAAAVVACGMLSWAARAAAKEQVHAFDAAIEIAADGSIKVTERIEVEAEGNRIRRGIYRDIPQIRSFGPISLRLPLEVLSVKRDEKREPYQVVHRGDGVRIYIGKEDENLARGVHRYRIVYRSFGQIDHRDAHDELYWNVTGNEWELPIARASARVILPNAIPAASIRLEAFTGASGAKGSDATMDMEAGEARFATDRALAPREGLTIVVGWPPGYVAQAGAGERGGWLLAGWAQVTVLDSLPGTILLLGTVALVVFYLLTWLVWGRDPPRGPVAPTFTPPDDITPADAMLLQRMEWSPRMMAVTLVDLAVRGKLRFEGNRGGLTLVQPGTPIHCMSPAERRAFYADLRPRERKLFDALFSGGSRVPLGARGKGKLTAALYLLREQCNRATKQLFSAPLHLAPDGIHAAPLALLIGSGIFILVMLLLTLSSGEPLLMKVVTWALLATVVALAGLVWRRAIRRRTPAGRRVMDQLDGLRLALAQQPGARLQAIERLLPYAMALGIEQRWASRLEGELRAASASHQGGGYSPDWLAPEYLGSSILASPLALCRTLDADLAPAGESPSLGGGGDSASSSSGESGFSAGSSGGGGGGGGGGGW